MALAAATCGIRRDRRLPYRRPRGQGLRPPWEQGEEMMQKTPTVGYTEANGVHFGVHPFLTLLCHHSHFIVT